MRIFNTKHLPWFIFVCLATIAAGLLYVGNFHPERMPPGIRLPPSLIQTPTEHHTVGGTPLGLAFGAISLGIFIFAALLSLRKKIPLWRVGTVQRWLRAHIWLTFLTIPLVILHSGFRLGGPMTTLLMGLYVIVMVSGIYGLGLQHLMPRLMKNRLPAETVFEQIPHIRAQLCVAAEKMRDSFKPAPPKKPDAGAPAPSPAKAVTATPAVMASTKGELSTPTARAKSATGSTVTDEPLAVAAATITETPTAKATETGVDPAISPAANAAASTAPAKPAETIGHSDGAGAKRTARRFGSARLGPGGRPSGPGSSLCSRGCAGGRCSGEIRDRARASSAAAKTRRRSGRKAGCRQTCSRGETSGVSARPGLGGCAGRANRTPDSPLSPGAARREIPPR